MPCIFSVLGTASVILADWDIPCGHKIAFGLATYSETVCALEKTNNICGIRTGDSQGKVFSKSHNYKKNALQYFIYHE